MSNETERNKQILEGLLKGNLDLTSGARDPVPEGMKVIEVNSISELLEHLDRAMGSGVLTPTISAEQMKVRRFKQMASFYQWCQTEGITFLERGPLLARLIAQEIYDNAKGDATQTAHGMGLILGMIYREVYTGPLTSAPASAEAAPGASAPNSGDPT